MLKYQAIASNGTFLRRILRETVYVRMVVMHFKESRTLDVFDTKIEQILEAGLIDYLDKDYSEYVNPKRYEHLHPKGPEVLTLEHLRAGFIIWLVSVSFALFVFIAEWVVRLKDLLIYYYLFSAFYNFKLDSTSEAFKSHIKNLSSNRQIVIEDMEVKNINDKYLAETK